MARIFVVGDSQFTLGFELAGIRDIVSVPEGASQQELDRLFSDLATTRDAGIVVSDEKTMAQLSKEMRKRLDNLSQPIFMALSEKEEQEHLDEMIKNSLGVDLSSM